MATFFTADTHFNHANILEYTNRPFLNVEEMDLEMIYRWNSVVRKNDLVFHLGDFAFATTLEIERLLIDILTVLQGGEDVNRSVLKKLKIFYLADPARKTLLGVG